MKTTPARSQASANAAFSDRKPYPGCTARAPAFSAASTIASTFRYSATGFAPAGSAAAQSAISA